jgi:hypothetical protein
LVSALVVRRDWLLVRVLQQLLQSHIDQRAHRLGQLGVLLGRDLQPHRAVARHLQLDPVPMLIPGNISAGPDSGQPGYGAG